MVRHVHQRDRDEAVGVLMMKNVLEFMQQQTAFFTKYRPSQPILEAKDVNAEIHGLKQRLRGFRKSYKWKKHREWPSIREMAEATDLLPLYDFVYASTTASCTSARTISSHGQIIPPTGEEDGLLGPKFFRLLQRLQPLLRLFLFITFCTTFAATLGMRTPSSRTSRS
jgi:hypothetical protein